MEPKQTQNSVSNSVATEKKQYQTPSIEVIILDTTTTLLSSSGGTGAGFKGVKRNNWD
ncbi:MAG: hypothetical protein J6V76_02330 [Bacteroidales bacterium]|nr:hypothetical protein [Bacteroidales bacterium]